MVALLAGLSAGLAVWLWFGARSVDSPVAAGYVAGGPGRTLGGTSPVTGAAGRGRGARRALFGRKADSVHGRSRGGSDEVTTAEAVDLVRLAVASGMGSAAALAAVAEAIHRGGPPGRATAQADGPNAATARELRSVAAAKAWGMDASRAWDQAGDRWGPARQAMVLADRAGVPAATLLGHAAAEMRRERAAALEVKAAKLPVRLVVPLGLLYLPAFMLITVVPLILSLARSVLATW